MGWCSLQLVVGYQYTGNPDTSYWIIRNSWSAWWGSQGYALVKMTGTRNGPCNSESGSEKAVCFVCIALLTGTWETPHNPVTYYVICQCCVSISRDSNKCNAFKLWLQFTQVVANYVDSTLVNTGESHSHKSMLE